MAGGKRPIFFPAMTSSMMYWVAGETRNRTRERITRRLYSPLPLIYTVSGRRPCALRIRAGGALQERVRMVRFACYPRSSAFSSNQSIVAHPYFTWQKNEDCNEDRQYGSSLDCHIKSL